MHGVAGWGGAGVCLVGWGGMTAAAAAAAAGPLDWLTPRAAAGEGSTLTQTAADIGAAAGTETIRVIGDLMIAEDVDRIVAETEAAFGSVDILVHNAGGNIRAGGAGGHPDPDDAIDIAIAGAASALAPLAEPPSVPISPAALSFLALLCFCLSHPRAAVR